MISIGYVNNEHPFVLSTDKGLMLESFLDKCGEEIDTLFSHYCESCEDYMVEEKIFKESGLDNNLDTTFIALEAEKDNFLKKIGDAIINTTKQVISFISGIIDKLKSITFKRKSDLQKLDLLCKEHPDLKDKIMKSFDDGSLSLADMRSFKEMDDTFEEILKLAKKKDIKPGSLQEKVEKMKEKIDNVDKMKIVKVAGAAATILGAVTAAVKLTDMLRKNAAAKSDSLEATIQQMKDANHTMMDDNGNARDVEYYNENMSKIHILYNAHNWRMKKYRQAAGEADSVIDKMMNKIMNIADAKGSPEKKAHFHDNIKLSQTSKEAADLSRMERDTMKDLQKKSFEKSQIESNPAFANLKSKPNNNRNNGGGNSGGNNRQHSNGGKNNRNRNNKNKKNNKR